MSSVRRSRGSPGRPSTSSLNSIPQQSSTQSIRRSAESRLTDDDTTASSSDGILHSECEDLQPAEDGADEVDDSQPRTETGNPTDDAYEATLHNTSDIPSRLQWGVRFTGVETRVKIKHRDKPNDWPRRVDRSRGNPWRRFVPIQKIHEIGGYLVKQQRARRGPNDDGMVRIEPNSRLTQRPPKEPHLVLSTDSAIDAELCQFTIDPHKDSPTVAHSVGTQIAARCNRLYRREFPNLQEADAAALAAGQSRVVSHPQLLPNHGLPTATRRRNSAPSAITTNSRSSSSSSATNQRTKPSASGSRMGRIRRSG